jgi:hypothetical protein
MTSFQTVVTRCNEIVKKDCLKEFQHVSSFKPGTQSLTGILSLKIKKDQIVYVVYKISNTINDLIEHETKISQSLSKITKFCPHFCRYITSFKQKICDTNHNPFCEVDNSQLFIDKNVILYEYLSNAKLVNELFDVVSIKHIFAIIKQIMTAIIIAQTELSFVHNDLHIMNVMAKKCKDNMLMLYIINQDEQYLVPTFGYYPVIIDYGFSYTDDLLDNSLQGPMNYTDTGHTPDHFDNMSDCRIFLHSVNRKLSGSKHKSHVYSKILKKLTRQIFKDYNINETTGFYQDCSKSATDYIEDILRDIDNRSSLFKDHTSYAIDILQTLIVLPIEEQPINDISSVFVCFIDEWLKFENTILNNKFRLLTLKIICENAYNMRAAYLNPETKQYAILDFSRNVKHEINNYAQFCNFDNVDFDNLLCSLILLARRLEGIFFNVLENIKEKRNITKKTFLNVNQIFACIDLNIDLHYDLDLFAPVTIINVPDKTRKIYVLDSKDVNYLKKLHPILRGKYLYEITK